MREHVGVYISFLQEQELQCVDPLKPSVHADHIGWRCGSARADRYAAQPDQQRWRRRLCRSSSKTVTTIVFGNEVSVIPTLGHTPAWRHLPVARPPVHRRCPDDRRPRAHRLRAATPVPSWTASPASSLRCPMKRWFIQATITVARVSHRPGKGYQPRLAGRSRHDFIELMNNLNLPQPRNDRRSAARQPALRSQTIFDASMEPDSSATPTQMAEPTASAVWSTASIPDGHTPRGLDMFCKCTPKTRLIRRKAVQVPHWMAWRPAALLRTGSSATPACVPATCHLPLPALNGISVADVHAHCL